MSVNGQDFTEPVYWLNKINLKTYGSKSGTELAALSGVQLGKIYRCNTTGSGFIINNYYMRNYLDNKWVVIYSIGGWQEILASSIQQGVYFASHFPRADEFVQFVASGGTITDDDSSGGIKIETQGLIDGRAMIRLLDNCTKMDWAKPAVVKFKMQFNDARQVLARIGLAVESYNTLTAGVGKQIGLQIDQPLDQDIFWSILTANGTTKSTQLTTNNPVSGSNTYRYILEYIPDVAVKLYVNGALIATKTTHLPNDGTDVASDTFSAVVRTKHANNKSIDLRSLVIAFSNGNNY